MTPSGPAGAVTAPWRRVGGTAVVTGGGSGLGAALAAVVASDGMAVVVCDVDGARAASVADAIAAEGGSATSAIVDVRRFDEVADLAERVFSEDGDVALLVNDAGVEHVGVIWEEPPEAWHRVVDTNLHGVYHGVRAFVPRMLDSGTPAAILNIASVAALTTGAFHGPYQVSKHGVLALSEVLDDELRSIGAPVQVSVALPGPIATRIYADAPDAPDPDRPGGQRLDFMRSLLSGDGMPPLEAARLLLDQVAAGSFAVTTHADWLAPLAAARIEQLRERYAVTTDD